MALQLCAILVFRILLHRLRWPVILGDIAVIAGYAMIILNLLARVGVNIPALVATSAVIAAVIGLALQDLLLNLTAGVAIHTEGAIRPGVWIRSEHGAGRVVNVRLRHTAIATADDTIVIIPNNSLTKVPVTVVSGGQRCLARFRLGAEHRPATVIRIVEEALAASSIEGIAGNPTPRCIVLDYQPQHIEYGIHVWVTSPCHQDETISRVLSRVYLILERARAPVASVQTVLEVKRPTLGGNREEALAFAVLSLRNVVIWESLADREIRVLAERMNRVFFGVGETIVRQGDQGDSMFIVLSGSVGVTFTAASGRAGQVATLERGGFFGEMSLLTGERRSASVVASTDVECGELTKEDVADLILERPELAREIAIVLEERQTALASVREKLEQASEISSKPDLLARIQRFFGFGAQGAH